MPGITDAGRWKPAVRRLGWFVLIWLLSVAALAVFAYGLRALLGL